MKKLKFSKDKVKTFGRKVKSFLEKHCVVYFKKYPLLFYFVVTVLFNTLLLRIITVGNFLYLKPLFADLGMLFIFSAFMFLFKNDRRRKKYLVVMSFVTAIICVIHSVYYTYYDSFASISLLATSTFVVDVGDAVVDQVLRFTDLLYLWQPIFMLSCYFMDKKKKKSEKSFENNSDTKRTLIKNKKHAFIDMLVMGLVILVCTSIFMTKTEWSRFGKLWNRESVVSSFGIFTYQINDICQSLEPKINNLFGFDKALKKVIDYYDEKNEETTSNKYTGIFEGMNVIVIHAESLQTIALESSFNGVEVAPTFKKLASEGIYFSNYYSQVGVGTSSDAEFTFSTSLMPSSNGTVFVNYFDREYQTIQKSFEDKGYYTFSMHGNTGDFWNRATMHKNMGYEKFYSKSSFDIDETIGLGISDKSFFKQAVPMLQDIINEKNQPFYGTLITLTNHTPWNDLELMDEYDTTWTVEIDGEQIVRDYISGTTIGDYFKSVHYMDQAMEQFLSDLDKTGILDNTVVVIYGDHDARISSKYYDLLYNYDPYTDEIKESGDEGYIDYNEYEYKLDKNVPFIIWTKNKKITKEITVPTGMIDAYPILSNLFGLEENEFQLGHDILGNGSTDNTVVFTDGSYVTSKIYYNGQNSEIYSVDGSAVDEEYIRKNSEYADELIDISNDIITYDLIKEIKEKE
ncbi:MAG: LTA synthase family protein [Bacilli bacterium]|nr:LTA synthase family protein [Bacilli bacterium]